MSETKEESPGVNRSRLLVYRVLSVAVVIAVGVLAGKGTAASPRAQSIRTAGVLSQSNSKDGSAILSATNLGPGDSRSGTVTITNTGNLAGEFELSKSRLNDLLGPAGGALSDALVLRVEDLSSGREVYRGGLRSMPDQPLGTFQPGESHTYRFTVGLPDRGAAVDNLFAGATTTVQYDWLARAAPPAGPASPQPAKPRGPSQAGEAAAGPKVTVKVARRQRLMRQRGIYLRVRCDKPCSVDLKVRLKAGARIGTPGWRVRRALPGARAVKVKVKIPRRDLARLRALLSRSRSIRILVAAKATDRKGASRGAVKASVPVPGR